MRTTITLEKNFLNELKERASERNLTLSRLIEETLRWAFAERPQKQETKKFQLPTYGHGGKFPDLDLDKTSALLETEDLRRFGQAPLPRDP